MPSKVPDTQTLSIHVGQMKMNKPTNQQKSKGQGSVSRTRQPGFAHSGLPNVPLGLASPLPGHCKEPPPWEHEASKRIYHFVVGQTLHYECAQGFRALQRGPAMSTCKSICGQARWTQPQLKCTKERTDSQGAGTVAPSGVHSLAFSHRPTGVEFLTHRLCDRGQATESPGASVCFSF